jgi:cytochrome c5
MHTFATLVFLCVLSSLAQADPPGKSTFERLCVSCHAHDGRGNPEKARALKIDRALLNLGRKETETLSRDDLRAILLRGKNKMPAYEKKLKPPEVEPVLDHALQLASALRGQK